MMDATALEERLRQLLADAPAEVAAAYLFGSVARGQARPDSDVDVGVLFRERPAARLADPALRLQDELAARLELPVQVVTLNDAPPDLLHRVLRDGRLLLDRDRALRIRFEVKARNAYFDLRPVLDLYRRAPARRP
jgi:predicted nucleotidyltransferase